MILPTPTEDTAIEEFAISNSVKVMIWYNYSTYWLITHYIVFIVGA